MDIQEGHMGKYQLCIFDLDGTLLNTLGDITNSINYIRNQLKLTPLTNEDVLPSLSYGLRAMLEKNIPKINNFDEVYKQYLDYYILHQNEASFVYDGIIDVLKTLKDKNIKILVYSNKRRENVQQLCDDYFSDLVDYSMGEDIEHGYPLKPDPSGILNILKELNISNDDCIYIGDSDVDFHTASNANIDFIAVSWGYRTEDFLKLLKVKTIASKPSQLIDLLT